MKLFTIKDTNKKILISPENVYSVEETYRHTNGGYCAQVILKNGRNYTLAENFAEVNDYFKQENFKKLMSVKV